MNFKEFNEMVKTYYPLNKDKSRYLIQFNDGTHAFYKRIKNTLIKEKWGYNSLGLYTLLNERGFN